MEYMEGWQFYLLCYGFMAVFVLLLVILWVALIWLWKSNLQGKRIFTGWQAAVAILWLLLLIVISGFTLFFLAIFIRF